MKEMDNQTGSEPHHTVAAESNWTSAPSSDSLFTDFRMAKHFLYGIILVLSVVGNTAVIYIMSSRRSIRKTSYILLVLNLAVCDVLTPTLSIPFDWTYEEYGHKWIFGNALCTLLWPLQTFFSTSSALTLTMICYDRYRAVVHPFKALSVTKKHIIRFILALHVVSLIFTMPYAIVLKLQDGECRENWPSPVPRYRKAYTLVLFLVQYGIPLVLMVTLHSLALKTLCSQSNEDEVLSGRSSTIISVVSNRSMFRESELSMQSMRRSYLHRQRNIRVTKIFVLVVTVFAISMFPNQVLWLWVDFGQGADNENFSFASVVCRLFTYSNSVINPIIYGFFSHEFRSGKDKLRRPTDKSKTIGGTGRFQTAT